MTVSFILLCQAINLLGVIKLYDKSCERVLPKSNDTFNILIILSCHSISQKMPRLSRKIILPRFILTEVVSDSDIGATKISISNTSVGYFVREKTLANKDGYLSSAWMSSKFNLFPLVLDATGAPWAEATVYLLSKIEGAIAPAMTTYASIADDLAAYRRFLDESLVNWTEFPAYKLNRPTYRFNGHLRIAIMAGDIASTTAKRRMSSVIAFYRWLQSEGLLKPENTPWRESDHFISIVGANGFKHSKKIKSTDVSIKISKSVDPFSTVIHDGGKLRPLTHEEQVWVLSALIALGNTEMTLIHLFAFLTGARIQTILTMRVKHLKFNLDASTSTDVRIPCGPGTSIDTKHNKQRCLLIPIWFYKLLIDYSISERAQKRRDLANTSEIDDQYIFLSIRGAPMYGSKEDASDFDEKNNIRHAKTGQGVRQFIYERVLPFIRNKYNQNFNYHFHDTRASFGMNLADEQLDLVSKGKVTLHQCREYLMARLWHESSVTTDLYIRYRCNQAFARAIGEKYDSHLKKLIDSTMTTPL